MIERLDLLSGKTLELARDMFMFGFYAKGMELIDIAMLRKDNLNSNTLNYNRGQRGKEHKVEFGEKAISIVNKYRGDDNDYMFPIIQRKYSYSTVRNEFADSLNKIGIRLQLPIKLTFSMNIIRRSRLYKKIKFTKTLVS